MKSLKFIVAGALALACAQVSNAQTVVRFTGSTAYRANVHLAIMHALGSTDGVTLTTGSYGYAASNLGTATQAIFAGTISGSSVIICTDWTGSEGGIQTVEVPQSIAFLPTSLVGTASMSTSGVSGLSAGTDMETPDIAMSDTSESSSEFNGNVALVSSSATSLGSTNYNVTLTDANNDSSGVGVVPFKWVASKGAAAAVANSGSFPLTNITSDIARSLYKGGSLPMSLFTANVSDSATTIYAAGRDIDSGTRLGALADIGYGVGAQTVVQYQPSLSGTYNSQAYSSNNKTTAVNAGKSITALQVTSTSSTIGQVPF